MSTNISVLSTESVNKLREIAKTQPELMGGDLEVLVDRAELVFLPTTYQINSTFLNLEIPSDRDWRLHTDKVNCLRVFNALPQLTPAQATDERLWLTLALFHCREYVTMRWPAASSDSADLTRVIDNHWFASGTRRRFRDNAISRLWWSARLAHQVQTLDLQAAVDTLFVNTEYVASVMARNTTSAAPNVTGAILKISEAHFGAGNRFNRDAFREFMKEVDLLNGKLDLAALEVEQLQDILEPIHREKHC